MTSPSNGLVNIDTYHLKKIHFFLILNHKMICSVFYPVYPTQGVIQKLGEEYTYHITDIKYTHRKRLLIYGMSRITLIYSLAGVYKYRHTRPFGAPSPVSERAMGCDLLTWQSIIYTLCTIDHLRVATHLSSVIGNG